MAFKNYSKKEFFAQKRSSFIRQRDCTNFANTLQRAPLPITLNRMKLTWKNRGKNTKAPLTQFPNLPFEQEKASEDVIADKAPVLNDVLKQKTVHPDDDNEKLAQFYQEEGNKLAEDGRYREALGKWETALTLFPERAVLHEQKAQILLELGDAWSSLKSALRATELEPEWAEAWITLGRAQLNFGEPDSSIESLNRALSIKPESAEALSDRQAAMHLITKRKQLHSTGLSVDANRFIVKDKD